MKMKSILTFLIVTALFGYLAADESMEKQFEGKYKAWREVCTSYGIMFRSDAGPIFVCNEFQELINLGLPALPYIAKKLEQDYFLWMAIEDIAKVKIHAIKDKTTKEYVYPDFPEAKAGDNNYLFWWREGHKLTKNKFDELFLKWKQAKEKNSSEQKKYFERMANLGLPVIPFMIDKIKKGENEFILAVSRLTDGEVRDNASAKDCIDWWKNNKDKWTIQFPDDESEKME